MNDIQLSLAMAFNARSSAIQTGALKPQSVEFHSTDMHPSEIFWRQLHYGEFDVSEMSMSSLLMTVARGNRDWVGIPVFSYRRFFHTGMWIRTDRKIDSAVDLRGKRVAVPEYQQTAALWCRGALLHEFGVHPHEIEWFMERSEAKSHGGAVGFQPPEGVTLHRIPEDKSIGSMLVSGEIDATVMYLRKSNLVDRSTEVLEGRRDVRLLFENPVAEGRRYYQKTGLYPVNHGMVIRRSIAERYPWIVLNIYNAFLAAKEAWLAKVREDIEMHEQLGLLASTGEGLPVDPYPYGVVANHNLLEAICSYSFEQGLTQRKLSIDEVFWPSTLEV